MIDVTQECVDKGRKGSPSCCPVAIALTNAGFTEPSVIATYAMVTNDKKEQIEQGLPPSVKDFIKRFDAGLPVEPFSFEPVALNVWDGTHWVPV